MEEEKFINILGKVLHSELLNIWNYTSTNKTREECRQHKQIWIDKSEIARSIIGFTLLDWSRLIQISDLLDSVENLEGEHAEFGTYKGGTARFISLCYPKIKLHCFDTFEGNPEDDKITEGHKKGDFADTSFEKVKTLLEDLNVSFHVGKFQDQAKLCELKLKFIHVDFDTYQATQSAIDFGWKWLSPGGVMLFDDFNWGNCPGVAVALNEKFKGVKVESRGLQAWVRKPITEELRPEILPSRNYIKKAPCNCNKPKGKLS